MRTLTDRACLRSSRPTAARSPDGIGERVGYVLVLAFFLLLPIFGTFGAPDQSHVAPAAAERLTDPRTTSSSVVVPGKVGASRRAGGVEAGR